MQFNEQEAAKYQENNFFELGTSKLSNKDIMDAVGLEYQPLDLSKKKTKKKA